MVWQSCKYLPGRVVQAIRVKDTGEVQTIDRAYDTELIEPLSSPQGTQGHLPPPPLTHPPILYLSPSLSFFLFFPFSPFPSIDSLWDSIRNRHQSVQQFEPISFPI